MPSALLKISGKVQGVWYRASAKDHALSLGLTGKVWNEPNGDVGAIAQGPEEKIQAFIEWCKQGPPLAKVTDVNIAIIPDPETFETFKITRNNK